MHKKLCLIATLMVTLALMGFGNQLLAGGPENLDTEGTIVGPEIWGEMIIDCAVGVLALRVKRIVDCNVQTQAFIDPTYALGCVANETTPLNRRLGVTLFDINPNPAAMDPIITKLKNFRQEPDSPDRASFDVQLKFFVPN